RGGAGREEELNGAIAERGGVKRDPSTAPRATAARWEERCEAPVGLTRHGWRMRSASDSGHGMACPYCGKCEAWAMSRCTLRKGAFHCVKLTNYRNQMN